MAELDDKLGSILNNPQMMQQIMSMAQAMGGSQDAVPPPPPPKQDAPFPEIDMATIQRLSSLAQGGNIDKRERSLLQALAGYLSKERVSKLEKAMRAAKIAKLASSAFHPQGSSSSPGR